MREKDRGGGYLFEKTKYITRELGESGESGENVKATRGKGVGAVQNQVRENVGKLDCHNVRSI